MSILKKLGLVKEDSLANPQPQAPVQNTTPSDFTTKSFGSSKSNELSGAEKSEEYVKHFDKLMEDANLPGPDFFEFIVALREMDSNAVPDNMKYKMTFSAFKAMGVTQEKLIQSGEQYLSIINQNALEFDKEASEEKARIDSIDNKVAQKQALIEDLNKQIAATMQEISSLQNEKLTKSNIMLVHENSFKMAHKSMVETVNKHLLNIKTYLNG